MEILLATSVLLGCVVVLSELANIGTKHVDDVEGFSTAQMICRTTLNEMLSGAVETKSFQTEAADAEPGWMVAAEVGQPRQSGVASLRVTAWYEDPAYQGLDYEVPRQHQFTLVRWTRDPYLGDGFGSRAGSIEPDAMFDSFGEDFAP